VVTLKKYNLKGDAVGEVNVDPKFLEVEANGQMIKDYIVALRANARQWSANTKGRTEVNHSNKKPWRQKGTGNARQGTLAAPQFKGGGVVFGPKPKFDQHVRINRKERRQAIRQLLADKMRDGSIILVEDAAFSSSLEKPKTKSVASFLKGHQMHGRRLLFVGESVHEVGKHDVFKKSMANLPRTAFVQAVSMNGYDLMAAYGVVMTESALVELTKLLM
jgi:large subunit ribosomal protein L4